MTLILGLMNRRHAVLVSDRRLSIDGRMTEDETNKAATFDCADSRLAFAFTGLAKTGHFVTNRWLLDAFAEAADADYLVLPTIHRVAKLATEQFKTVRVARPRDKCLSVLCAGYRYDGDGPRGLLALISNFERLDGHMLEAPSAEFNVDSRIEKLANESGMSAAVVVGISRAVSDEHIGSLVQLVKDDKPANALGWKSGRGVEGCGGLAESERIDWQADHEHRPSEQHGRSCGRRVSLSHEDAGLARCVTC